MSVTLMARVWKMDLPTTDKMVLLALADAANDDGITWIPITSKKQGEKLDLLRKCSLSERAIQGAIKRLKDEGLIKRDEKPGRGCIYTVLPPQDMRPAADAPPQQTTSTPAADAPKPSITTISEAKASSDRVIAHWNAIAKKHGFQEARVVDASRRQTIRLRVKEHGEEQIILVFDRLAASPWMRGHGRDSKWRPDLDFALRATTIRKALEGGYDDEGQSGAHTWDEEERRASQLRTADMYDRMGRSEEAEEIRRQWSSAQAIGAVALKIVEGGRK